jgi:glyoxylase-like metal-dependent hydrolase (beta-lactamase superfamily II)
VRVHTQVGWIVLASDATHLYANLKETRPFPIVYDVPRMVAGYRRLAELADAPELIVPGHDPLVMRRYPPASAELEGIVVRLDHRPSPERMA